MNLKAILIGIMLFSVGLCFGQPNQKLTLSDIKSMEAKDRARFLMTLTPAQLSNPNDFLDALTQGITDSDASVRLAAAGKAAYAMVGLQQMKKQGQTMPVKLEAFTAFQNSLVGALSDPNAETRSASAGALIYSDAPNRSIESALVGYLSNEPDSLLRISVAKEMHKAGYSSSVIDAQILKGLKNPDSQVRMEAARAAGVAKVAGALPKLALLLNDKEMVRGHIVAAIAAYGSEAKPYVAQLEAMLASGEVGGTLVSDLMSAIDSIKNPQPQAPDPAQIKPVSLADVSTTTPTLPTTELAPRASNVTAPVQQPKVTDASTIEAEKKSPSDFPIVPLVIVAAVILGIAIYVLRRKSS